VLGYLDSHGFAMASYDRLRERVGNHLTDEMLEDLIRSRPDMFRHATIKGGKQGIAKRVPWN
jgi:hypothetical protein